jgi:hypothetical protein
MDERKEILRDDLISLGFALVDEGDIKVDRTLKGIGEIMLFLSSLVSDEDTLTNFGNLASMLSSKRLVDSVFEENEPNVTIGRDKESLDELKDRLSNKLNTDFRQDPPEEEDDDNLNMNNDDD